MDTPAICNVIESVAPKRRGHGYTTWHLCCPFPDLPPRVGFAETVTTRAKVRYRSAVKVTCKGVTIISNVRFGWWSQPFDATLYLIGKRWSVTMDQRFGRGFT